MAISDTVKRGRREESLSVGTGLLLYFSPVVVPVHCKFYYLYCYCSSVLPEKLKLVDIQLFQMWIGKDKICSHFASSYLPHSLCVQTDKVTSLNAEKQEDIFHNYLLSLWQKLDSFKTSYKLDRVVLNMFFVKNTSLIFTYC